jgi:hypothetical protein
VLLANFAVLVSMTAVDTRLLCHDGFPWFDGIKCRRSLCWNLSQRGLTQFIETNETLPGLRKVSRARLGIGAEIE